MKKWNYLAAMCALFAVLCVNSADADVFKTVEDGSAPWLGFMNVFNLPPPEGDGAYQFGSPWGVPDLVATFATPPNPTVTLSPNTISDPDPYWYQGGGGPGAAGNKIMQANLYIEETGPLAGETVIFQGNVTDYSFTNAHATRAFIKDFASDYSSVAETYFPLSGTGAFSFSLTTINDPNRHVQFGFETTGVNVWNTDVGPFGSITITAIPEPSSGLLLGLTVFGLAVLRRSRLK